MSADSSDDAEFSKLQRAAEFMRGVRLTQAGSAKKFMGSNRLSSEQQYAITDAISNSAFVRAVKESLQADRIVNHMAERFEEMARRQGSYIEAELRPAMVKLLAAELWVNQKSLEQQGVHIPAEKLISSTVHQGAVAPELIKEFGGQFPPSCIGLALARTPALTRDFLSRVSREIETLAAEPKFQRLAWQRPSAFYHSAFHRPADMRSKLSEMVKTRKK